MKFTVKEVSLTPRGPIQVPPVENWSSIKARW